MWIASSSYRSCTGCHDFFKIVGNLLQSEIDSLFTRKHKRVGLCERQRGNPQSVEVKQKPTHGVGFLFYLVASTTRLNESGLSRARVASTLRSSMIPLSPSDLMKRLYLISK